VSPKPGSFSRSSRSFMTSTRLAIAGVSAMVLLVAFAIFSVGWSAFVVSQRTAELSRQLTAIAAAEALSSESTASPARDQLLRVEAGLLGAALFVADADGVVLRTSETDTSVRSLDLAPLGEVDERGVSSGTVRGAAGARVLVVVAPIGDGRQLVAVQRLSEIRAAQAGVIGLGGLGLLVALIVAWFAGGWLSRRLTRPLLALESGAERIASGEFGAQVTEDGEAEIASLARSFNRMSTRVADAYDAQQAFVGDVSHEIRTPLTSIAGFAHALLDGTVADDAGRRRAATVIAQEAARIGELTTTLLALSQLDAGAVEVRREPVDLTMLADALAGRFAPAALTRGIGFEIDLPASPQPLGDPERLLQCVSALLANAFAHVSDGGAVSVSAWATDGAWRLAVDDDGPGVPVHKRQTVFQRFTRLDESRSSGSGGAGLGLAISARLIELMGGSIRAEDSPLGGARFLLQLPVDSTQTQHVANRV